MKDMSMFNKIPKQRLLLYILIVGFLPALLVVIHFFVEKQSLEELEKRLKHVQELSFVREKKQAVNISLRNHFRDADHFYIDKHLETLIFLEPEIEALQKISSNKNYADDEYIKKRLDFLSGNTNSLAFSEGVVQSYPLFQETTETLTHPVEVNVSDIKRILARVEGVEFDGIPPPEHRPQLIILDFKLDKKTLSEKNEVYLLNLKLLKREFL